MENRIMQSIRNYINNNYKNFNYWDFVFDIDNKSFSVNHTEDEWQYYCFCKCTFIRYIMQGASEKRFYSIKTSGTGYSSLDDFEIYIINDGKEDIEIKVAKSVLSKIISVIDPMV